VCFYGHTHFAVVFRLIKDLLEVVSPANGDTLLTIEPQARYLVNPGSVGQPRDGDPRAAYVIYDTETKQLDLIRLAYPLEMTQEKMLKVGLPDPLARRLALGR
jgi:diadenosine tetraphosphatase ApaH/serine/threonine PP2A family protein phosphatase